jgi:hypothetical protein
LHDDVQTHVSFQARGVPVGPGWSVRAGEWFESARILEEELNSCLLQAAEGKHDALPAR